MSEVAEVAQVASVTLNGTQMAAKGTAEFFKLLKRLITILGNLIVHAPDNFKAFQMKKNKGKTKLEILQMKDNVQPKLLSDEMYNYLKKNGKKYNIQWTKAVKVEGDENNRIFIASSDLPQYEALLSDYAAKVGKKPEELSQDQDLLEYMFSSNLATCTDEQFDKAMKVFAKDSLGIDDYDKITPEDLGAIQKEITPEKKEAVENMIRSNAIREKMHEDGVMSLSYSTKAVIAEEKGQKKVPVEGTVSEYMWLDNKNIYALPMTNGEKFVAIMPENSNVKVYDARTKETKEVQLKTYMDSVEARKTKKKTNASQKKHTQQKTKKTSLTM